MDLSGSEEAVGHAGEEVGCAVGGGVVAVAGALISLRLKRLKRLRLKKIRPSIDHQNRNSNWNSSLTLGFSNPWIVPSDDTLRDDDDVCLTSIDVRFLETGESEALRVAAPKPIAELKFDLVGINSSSASPSPQLPPSRSSAFAERRGQGIVAPLVCFFSP